MIVIKKIRLYLSIGILIVILCFKINDDYNDEIKLFEVIKNEAEKEIDLIKVSKDFFGKLNVLFFEEDSLTVSNSNVKYLLNDGSYYVVTDEYRLINESSGICTKIIKEKELYAVTITTEYQTITYSNLESVSVRLYQNVEQLAEIGLLDYEYGFYYVVKYES